MILGSKSGQPVPVISPLQQESRPGTCGFWECLSSSWLSPPPHSPSWKKMDILSTRWRMGCPLTSHKGQSRFILIWGPLILKGFEIFIWNAPPTFPHSSLCYPHPQIIIYGPHTSAMAIKMEGKKIHLWLALVSHLKGFVGANYFVQCLIAMVTVVFWTSTKGLKLCVCF